MQVFDIISDARIISDFANKPFSVLEFGNGTATVVDKDGNNCLTFSSYPVPSITTVEVANKLCEIWNDKEIV